MANEGTVIHIETDDEGRFKMCFIAFVLRFLTHMQPLLITNGAHLKGTYKGTNLVLVGMDGNNQIIPIATGVSQGTVKDKILVPKPSKNYARCTRCGYLVDGPNCQGCALLRQELEENLDTHFPDFQYTSEPSNASTNVANAPREPNVVKQDNESFVNEINFDFNRAPDSPNQFYCFHLKDVLRDEEACKRCTCAKCGSGLGKGLCYICGHNQNSLNDSPTESPFTLDSTPTYVDESPNVFNPPPQPPVYTCEFWENDAYFGHYCTPQALFIYPEPCYNPDFNFPQNFQNVPQQYSCCDDCGQYTVNHPIFNAHHDLLGSQKKLNITLTKVTKQMTKLTSMCEMACQLVQKKQEEKHIEEEQAAKAQTWKLPVCYDDEDDEEGYNPLNDNIISKLPPYSAVTSTEPVDSLSIGDEHLNTIPAMESDEFIKSCVEKLVQNPSESEGENGCDVLACLTTFSNVLFDADYDSDSSDDQSLSYEDVLEKIYPNPLFDEEIIPIEIDQHSFIAESDLIESMPNHDSSVIISSKIDSLFDEFAGELTLLKSILSGIDETDCHLEKEIHLTKRLLYDNSSPRPPEEIISDNSNADIESFSPSPIPNKDSDSLMEEINLSFNPDDPMPSGIEDDDYDSGRDIPILEELLDNYSLSLPASESYHFDIPLPYRPPAKPLDGDDRRRVHQVDLPFRTCTCRKWQPSGIPCGHENNTLLYLPRFGISGEGPSSWVRPDGLQVVKQPNMNFRTTSRPKNKDRIKSQGEEPIQIWIIESSCVSDRWGTKVSKIIPRALSWRSKEEFNQYEYFGEPFCKEIGGLYGEYLNKRSAAHAAKKKSSKDFDPSECVREASLIDRVGDLECICETLLTLPKEDDGNVYCCDDYGDVSLFFMPTKLVSQQTDQDLTYDLSVLNGLCNLSQIGKKKGDCEIIRLVDQRQDDHISNMAEVVEQKIQSEIQRLYNLREARLNKIAEEDKQIKCLGHMNSSAHIKLAIEHCVPKKMKYVDVLRSSFYALPKISNVPSIKQLANQKNVLNPLMIEKYKSV
uniref:Transposase, MuDR, MULE transposase domain protein n=1 Tax=Tanacetum cinerariifolium TaxID=118510 RepID=A0A6L2KEP7_TANCI|nr:transposase, MuDR, MULE transposase domain protein [Tanacetum cinerariifolium]